MALTGEIPTTYRPTKRIVTRFKKLLWGSTILFTVNVMVLFGIAVSPEWKVDMYGQADEAAAVDALKPTPFVQPVQETRRAVRTAPKLEPVIETATNFNEAELQIPIRSVAHDSQPAARSSNYISGDRVYAVVEGEANYPRMSAAVMKGSTALPRSTPVEIPRKTSLLN